jgi:stage II sporulation protein D
LKRIFSHILLLVVVLMTSYSSPVQANSLEPAIRVGILSDQQNVLISADTNFAILNAITGELLAHFVAGEKATIAVKEKAISINGQQVSADKLMVLKFRDNGEHYFEVNKKQYRGYLTIHPTHGKTGLTIVNTLPIEQYLYGVIAREISPNWPLETIKAQAVAARSYALYTHRKHQDDDYDVCATTDCQVYGGRSSEKPQTNKAVDDTSGQVITYNDKIIPAYFHSSSGGYTENSENVWGTYQPYLRGVVDYDQNSPQYKWEKKLTVNELNAAIAKAGYTIGTIKAIEVMPLTNKFINTPERGVSGRVKAIRLIGSTGSIQMSGEKLRKILELKSTLFDVSVMGPAQQIGKVSPIFHSRDLDGTKEEIHPIGSRPNETVVISGFGWGHGLGLSQWGAKAMAEKGPQGDITYFKEILKHYYQGTTIKKVF